MMRLRCMKTLSRILPSLDDVAIGARLLTGLPGFLRRSITLDQARAVLRQRLKRREADFLDLVLRSIYGRASSPYRQLLRVAGCEAGDIERLVLQEGVEGTLLDLYRNGVYLTVDEFKGRRPAIRGSSTIEVDPLRLRNPHSGGHLRTWSSGSRGQ